MECLTGLLSIRNRVKVIVLPPQAHELDRLKTAARF
jgi:hypothetical protein